MRPITPQPSHVMKTEPVQVGHNPELSKDLEKQLAALAKTTERFSVTSQATKTEGAISPTVHEIPTVGTLTSIIESATTEATSRLPFNADYTSLNKLKYIKQLMSQATKKNDRATLMQLKGNENDIKEYFIDAFKQQKMPWFIKQRRDFENMHFFQRNDVDLFISFLIKNTSLPETYADYNDHTQFAERRFPSADIANGKDPFEFAHFFQIGNESGGILASHVPHHTLNREKDEENMQSFLEMLWRHNVSVIVSLGGNAERLKYSEHVPHDATSLFSTSDNGDGTITLQHKDGSTQEIKLLGYSVEDETPLNLSNEDARQVIQDIFERSKTETVLIHCDSGVGRTGMLNAIVHLLNAYEKDAEFKRTSDYLLMLLTDNPDNATDIKTQSGLFYRKAAEIVAELRKIRFTIQTEKQFQHLLSQTLICLAVKNNLEESEISNLRKSLNIPIKDKGLDESFYSTPPSSTVASAASSTNATPLTSQSNLTTLRFLGGGSKPSGFNASRSPRSPVVSFDPLSSDSLSRSASPHSSPR